MATPDEPGRPGDGPSPLSVEEALSRATAHARNAVAESLLSARALLDAVAIAWTGRAADDSGAQAQGLAAALAGMATTIDRLAARARGADTTLPPALASALIGALEAEIERWEQRSASDPDARAVLRAFLGLREILWELGVRPSDEAVGSHPGDGVADSSEPQRSSRRDPARSSPRMQRPRDAASDHPRVRRIEVDP